MYIALPCFLVYSPADPPQYGTMIQTVLSNSSEVLIRSSYLITIVFMLITAAVLAEICSALPLSGSIYIWAAESAGPKYARFFGFVVAWWACTAWMTFTASNCQVCILHISLAVFLCDQDHGQLHHLAIDSMGGRLSWRHYKR